MNGWTDGRNDSFLNRWQRNEEEITDQLFEGERKMDSWIDEWKDRLTEGWVDGWKKHI